MANEFNDNSVTNGEVKSNKQILLGRVTKVILSEFTAKGGIDPDFANQGGWGSIGSVKYNLFTEPGNPQSEVKTNNFAKPLFGNLKQFPLVGEIIALIPGPSTRMNEQASAGDFYYIASYNLWNSQHHNAFPDPVEYAKYQSKNFTTNQQKSQGAKETKGHVDLGFPLGFYFKERPDVNTVLPFEGDVIIEGRHGQAIRFGSTVKEQKGYSTWSKTGKTGDPITIITNRRAPKDKSPGWIPTVEDINKDGSSIWLSSGQAINIDVSMYPLDTFRLGFQATYNADSVLPLVDLSPGIQNIASAEYDKRVLDRITDAPQSTSTFDPGSSSSTTAGGAGGTIDTGRETPPSNDNGSPSETEAGPVSSNPSDSSNYGSGGETTSGGSGGGGGSSSGGGSRGSGGINRDEDGNQVEQFK